MIRHSFLLLSVVLCASAAPQERDPLDTVVSGKPIRAWIQGWDSRVNRQTQDTTQTLYLAGAQVAPAMAKLVREQGKHSGRALNVLLLLKEESEAAAEARDKLGPDADLNKRFEILGEGVDREHQIKAALINMVTELSGVEARNRELQSRLLGLEEQVSDTEQVRQQLDAVQGEAATARRELIELAAQSGAAIEDRKRIREELESERSSREAAEAAMAKLRDDENAIRELRGILGLKATALEAIGDEVRNLRSTADDRDRWVAALLSELSNRRLKLSRRGLMEHERKFLEDRDRAEG